MDTKRLREEFLKLTHRFYNGDLKGNCWRVDFDNKNQPRVTKRLIATAYEEWCSPDELQSIYGTEKEAKDAVYEIRLADAKAKLRDIEAERK